MRKTFTLQPNSNYFSHINMFDVYIKKSFCGRYSFLSAVKANTNPIIYGDAALDMQYISYRNITINDMARIRFLYVSKHCIR